MSEFAFGFMTGIGTVFGASFLVIVAIYFVVPVDRSGRHANGGPRARLN